MQVVAVHLLVFLDDFKHSALALFDAFGQEVDGLLGISVDEVVNFRLARDVSFFLGTNRLSASLGN